MAEEHVFRVGQQVMLRYVNGVVPPLGKVGGELGPFQVFLVEPIESSLAKRLTDNLASRAGSGHSQLVFLETPNGVVWLSGVWLEPTS